MAYAKVPMVTPASPQVHSLPGPFQRLMQAAAAVEDNQVLSASVFTVQPWLDIPEMGSATVAITDGDADLARRVAIDLAEQTWSEREALMDIDLVPPDEAIRRAMASPSPPVVLSDLADGDRRRVAGRQPLPSSPPCSRRTRRRRRSSGSAIRRLPPSRRSWAPGARSTRSLGANAITSTISRCGSPASSISPVRQLCLQR